MSDNTVPTNPTQVQSLIRAIGLGAASGLVGGVLFGIMMGMGGMLPMVGMLVGQPNPIVGFVVHMLISATIGASFGAIASRLPTSWGILLGAGAVYGVIWWVLGALVLMPLMLGMRQMVFVIEEAQIMSLIGHIIFGVAMGGAFKFLFAR